MGYAFMIGSCFACGRIFTFNPVRVPSVRDINGIRQPVCRTCVDRINPLRKQKGLPGWVVVSDAYEACDESELE